MFNERINSKAIDLIGKFRNYNIKIVTAESCTGGLLSGALTEVPGSSEIFERGFITYQNIAKIDDLSIPEEILTSHGAVSKAVALAMARGALERTNAAVSIAITGIAGPGGGSAEKPVGLVHISSYSTHGLAKHQECQFGDIGRSAIRIATVESALTLLHTAIQEHITLTNG